MRKPKGSVQPNPIRVVRRMAVSEAAPPSEPTDGRRGHPALVLSPRSERWEVRVQGQRWRGVGAGRGPWSGRISCCLPLGLRTEAVRP